MARWIHCLASHLGLTTNYVHIAESMIELHHSLQMQPVVCCDLLCRFSVRVLTVAVIVMLSLHATVGHRYWLHVILNFLWKSVSLIRLFDSLHVVISFSRKIASLIRLYSSFHVVVNFLVLKSISLKELSNQYHVIKLGWKTVSQFLCYQLSLEESWIYLLLS